MSQDDRQSLHSALPGRELHRGCPSRDLSELWRLAKSI